MRRSLVLLAVSCLALSGCPDARGTAGDTGAADAGVAREDADVDTGARTDAGVPMATCDAMDAHTDVCAAPCAEVTSAFWDGAACVAAHCDCAGTECDLYRTLEACEAAHAGCDATLCAASGGAWHNRLEHCGHFTCGVPAPEICEVPTRACDCGTYRVFMDGVGCVDGALCELVAPREPEELCSATGGEWMPSTCGPATCGRLSDLACASGGCVCGALEIFDEDRGCIRSPSCDVREPGEACEDTGLCGGGTVCCATGGASTASSCVAPLCDDPAGICGPPRP
jgi:hypothetical protein